jgi:phage replication initiation protein
MKSDISENVVLYDWVTISCKAEDPAVLMQLVGLKGQDWEPMKKGMNGYKQGFFCNNISVLYDGQEGMGTCLNMSGQGCRAFEEYGTGDFNGLFQLVQDNSEFFNLTRLDVAFDDHTGILDIQQLFHDCDEKEFVSKFRKAKLEKEFDDHTAGITVYHGSKQSVVLVRIYDKAAERGYIDGMHWVRVELQLRDERAFAFISAPEMIGEKFRGVLLNYVRYVDSDPIDTNRWRWPMKGYWAHLIAAAEKIQLYVKPGVEYNVAQLDRFVFQQAGNAVAAALEIYGVSGFCNQIRKRSTSQNPKYEKLIKQYPRKPGNSGYFEPVAAVPDLIVHNFL